MGRANIFYFNYIYLILLLRNKNFKDINNKWPNGCVAISKLKPKRTLFF